jgi:hypothetical protein
MKVNALLLTLGEGCVSRVVFVPCWGMCEKTQVYAGSVFRRCQFTAQPEDIR